MRGLVVKSGQPYADLLTSRPFIEDVVEVKIGKGSEHGLP